MKKPTQEFTRVTDAQRAAIEGLQSYTDKVAQDRELAVRKCDELWETVKRRFEPKPEHEFHNGMPAPRLTPMEYRKLRAEHLLRRQAVVDRFDEKAKDIRRVRETVLDRFNERSVDRTDVARTTPSRGQRSHLRNRDRGR